MRFLSTFHTTAIPLAVLALAALPPPRAQAQNCADLGPNVVIGAGGSASTPLLRSVGAALRDASPPLILVYQDPGACVGFNPYVSTARISGSAKYWDADGTERQCQIPAPGIVPDFAMLGTAATLCPGVTALPAGLGDFPGPITSWSLIVPTSSTEQVISAEAAYLLYGFGPVNGQVSPWTEPAHLWGRNATSAALIAIALAINVPAERMAQAFTAGAPPTGRICRDNACVLNGVATSGVDAALGFVSTEVADTARDRVRTLAYQHYQQSCGYWPDSTATSTDRANVRDGHYFLWSAYHFYAPVDGANRITDDDTRRFVDYFLADPETLPPEVPLIDLVIQNGNIPECAMNVWRDADLGPLYSYQPANPCGCYFENVQTGATDCTPCNTANPCPGTQVCRLGFCEVQ